MSPRPRAIRPLDVSSAAARSPSRAVSSSRATELDAQGVRELEVVAEHLLVRGGPVARPLLEPVGELRCSDARAALGRRR